MTTSRRIKPKKKPSKASRLKAESRAEKYILWYINSTAGLISLLYDMNALPEFCPLGTRRRALMRSVAVGWMACENKHKEDEALKQAKLKGPQRFPRTGT